MFRDIPSGTTILKHPIWEPYYAYKRMLGRRSDEKINAAFLTEKKKNKLLENISVWIRGNFFIPDARKFWIRPSVRFLGRYLQEHPVDAVVSTGPPHSMHLIAMKLSQRLNLPWLADFRDPWTNIDFYRDLRLTGMANRKHHRLERFVLGKANAVTVISRSMAEDFARIVPREYEVITNGYDSDDTSHPAGGRDSKFSIAHIGTLVSTRNPVVLWEVLQELVKEKPDFEKALEIKLVGKVDISVTASLESRGLDRFVRKIDYMPHDQVVRCQQQSQVLLLIINNTPNAKMILTGKFFEYLAAQRPILCLGPPDGDAAAILRETGAGLLADFGDTGTLKSNVLEFFRHFSEGTLETSSRNIGQFSRKELTRKMALVLDRITGSQEVN